MNPVELIIRKRDGRALPAEAIQDLIRAYTRDEVPDYQMSAFLMAAFLQGLDEAETAALTDAMLHSGRLLDLSDIPGLKVGKHSTGGVGDKVSLILAPVVAACGVPVPKISGRGLGHTGGTLDKLESIPGFRTDLTTEAYRTQLEKIGLVLSGQTAEIAPADRKLYALRDVTGTVESIPFIAASIMSKKLAEGIDALVLDVKSGRGAFMKAEADARRLAEALVGIGERFGKPTVALLTDMNAPLGYAVGNWPEIVESVQCLQGAAVPGLMEVILALAGEMLCLGGVAASPDEGRQRAQQALDDGRAFDKFVALAEAQGGDPSVLHQPEKREGYRVAAEVKAPAGAEGYVTAIDSLALGYAAVALGAGRARKEDNVDPTAGFVLHKQVGDSVRPGEVLADVYTRKRNVFEETEAAVQAAYSYGAQPAASASRLLDRYAQGQWANR